MSAHVIFRKLRSARTRLRQVVQSQRFGFGPSTIYDDAFFDGPGCAQGRESADAVARVLHRRFAPRTMFDFGCGTGETLTAMAELDVIAFGCEGSIQGVRRCDARLVVFQADLKQPVHLNRKFDLVTCIEVAEHLPKRSERVLVQSIASAAGKHVMFSASVPGQPGDDHINLQPPEHWARLFQAEGLRWLEDDTKKIREEFSKSGAPFWLQNAIVLER